MLACSEGFSAELGKLFAITNCLIAFNLLQTRQELLSNDIFHFFAWKLWVCSVQTWFNLWTAWFLTRKLAWCSKCAQAVGSGFWCKGSHGRIQAWFIESCSLRQHSCLKLCSLEYLHKVKRKGLSVWKLLQIQRITQKHLWQYLYMGVLLFQVCFLKVWGPKIIICLWLLSAVVEENGYSFFMEKNTGKM